MQKFRDVVLDRHGNAVLSATITVTNNADGSSATIYSDNGVTALGNPFTASSVDGAYEFYAAYGRYNVTITKVGMDAITIPDIRLVDISPTQTITGTGGTSKNIDDITAPIIYLVTTGAAVDIFRLLSGGTEGQKVFLVFKQMVDASYVSLAHVGSGPWSELVLNFVGEAALLLYTNGFWYILTTTGDVDPA